MTVSQWLKQGTLELEKASTGTARLDTLVLLEAETGINRATILAEPNTQISSEQLVRLKNVLNRRIEHEPLAYILGKKEFYGREFVLTRDVLEPRPESETMIDELKVIVKSFTHPFIVDVGTGSGALGITAKLELPEAVVTLIDIDPKALQIAKTNVDLFTIRASTLKSDLLNSFTSPADILLCNLPYVPDDFKINKAASFEPRLAIFGGPDGLELYRKLFDQLKYRRNVPLYLLTESLPFQHEALKQLAAKSGYKQLSINDFIQVFKRTQK